MTIPENLRPESHRMIMQYVRRTSTWLSEKGFFDLLIVKFLTQFLGFGSILFVAKYLSAGELADVKIIQSYVAIFSLVAGFGFNTAVLKVCAENRSDDEKDGILQLSLSRSVLSTLFTLLLLLVLTLSGVIASSPRLAVWLLVYALVIPLDVAANLFTVFLQAKKKIKEMSRAQVIVKAQSVALVVLSTWLWGFKGFIFSTVAAYAVGLWPFLRQIGFSFLRKTNLAAPAHFMQYALFSVLANGVGLLGQRSDLIILDHFFSNREEIGYYSLALTFVMIASQVTGTVQSIVTPYFSQHARDETWFRRQLLLNQVRMSLLSLVVAAGVYLLASVLIPLIYGPAYASTLRYLLVLLITYVIWSSYAVMGPSMLGMGLMHYNFVIVAITTPIGFALSYFLLQKLGIIGVAWAQVGSAAVTLVLVLLGLSLALKKQFGQAEEAASLS